MIDFNSLPFEKVTLQDALIEGMHTRIKSI